MMSKQERGCPLLGIDAYPDLEAQRQRFEQNGWDRVESYDMNTIYEEFIDAAERKRLASRILLLV